ncbi:MULTISPECIES: DUF4190 domain-containing protein [unclassified Brevibacterium]|uniref:DUF4190 domain-containing protein n=1 Tax=unclassified Brevibacterium TaxID=2614124 RepID=UPI000C40F5E1|nr:MULTISPECIES: DUF4190 domain-containing protein [unclassified Brevibacterium]SMX99664.1 protein of unknown function (DUF4190) [Brevibacterium sp. 239c]
MSSQSNWNNPDMYYQQPQSGTGSNNNYGSNADYSGSAYTANAVYGANTQYAGPGPAVVYQPLPPTNSLAIIALVTSIFGVMSGVFLAGIAGIIMGHIARKQIQESGERGGGMTTAALWVGYGGTALWLVFWLLMILFYLGMFALMFATT